MTTQKNRKTYKYYIGVFITATVVLALFGIYGHRRQEITYLEWVQDHVYYPFFITIFMFFYYTLTNFAFKKVDRKNEQQEFILYMSKKVREAHGFSVEDIRKLRENARFQSAFSEAYAIYVEGETETLNYDLLAKRFKEGSNAKAAMQVIIEELKVLRAQNEDK